jgi:hypothetical protein
MSHRDHIQVPPSHAARDIPGKPTARDYAVEPDPGLYRRSAVPRQAGRLECQRPRLCSLQTVFAAITLQVDAEVAKALTAASPQEQRKIQLLLRLRLQDLTSHPRAPSALPSPVRSICGGHSPSTLHQHPKQADAIPSFREELGPLLPPRFSSRYLCEVDIYQIRK